MTHNIQIGINVDDESIIRGVHQAAIRDIQRGLFGRMVTSEFYRSDDYHFTREFKRDVLDPYFDKLMQDPGMRDAIAKYAAEILSEKLSRSSTFKQQVSENMKEPDATKYSIWPNDVFFASQEDAQTVLDLMIDHIQQNKSAPIRCLYEYSNLVPRYSHTDKNYGWTNLNSATVSYSVSHKHWMINLPAPHLLENDPE